jgi:hypothetical protein
VELEDGSFWEVNLLVFWAVGWERNEKERKKVGLLKKDPEGAHSETGDKRVCGLLFPALLFRE